MDRRGAALGHHPAPRNGVPTSLHHPKTQTASWVTEQNSLGAQIWVEWGWGLERKIEFHATEDGIHCLSTLPQASFQNLCSQAHTVFCPLPLILRFFLDSLKFHKDSTSRYWLWNALPEKVRLLPCPPRVTLTRLTHAGRASNQLVVLPMDYDPRATKKLPQNENTKNEERQHNK